MGLKFWTVLIWGKSKAYSNNSCFLSQETFIAMARVIAWRWQEPWHGDGKSYGIGDRGNFIARNYE